MKSRYLTTEEISRLSASLKPREWLPFRVACETGLRIGDVLKIRVEDLDEKNVLSFTAEKTGKSGTVKLKNSTAKALRAAARGEWCFPSPRKEGAHITRQAAWERVKRAARRSGVDVSGCSPHSFRKAYAVELYAEKGIGAVRVALQHTSEDVTSIYALADWITGENALKPLLRGDLPKIVEAVKKSIETDKAC